METATHAVQEFESMATLNHQKAHAQLRSRQALAVDAPRERSSISDGQARRAVLGYDGPNSWMRRLQAEAASGPRWIPSIAQANKILDVLTEEFLRSAE